MPWKIAKQGKGYQLVNMVTGKAKGPSYKSRASALDYQRALYANDPAARAEAKAMHKKKGK